MRMLASAMTAAAGLGTAAGVALVAHHADPPIHRPVTVSTGRVPVTASTRTVLVIRPAGPTQRKPKQHHGRGNGGKHGKGKGTGKGGGDGG